MYLILTAVAAFALSFWLSGKTIRLLKGVRFGIDHQDGVQKVHLSEVPRIGGLAVFLAFTTGLLFLAWITGENVPEAAFIVVCILPAFGIGLLEDFTRKAGSLSRLIFPMIGAALAWWLLDAKLEHVDTPLLDTALASSSLFAFAFTLFAVTGVSHATNIVDGCNGLSSFIGMAVLGAIAVVAFSVGDQLVATTAVVAFAALSGFFLWNFPMGRIFIGDGGAYMIGFLIAVLSIVLVRHNPEVSPWFPLAAMFYPIWETVHSMYRRAVIRGLPMTQPDKLHLHKLIYHRAVKFLPQSSGVTDQAIRSSIASAYLWVVTLMCVVPAMLFWDRSGMLKLSILAFILVYLRMHSTLVRFRTPRLFQIRRAPPPTPVSETE